jgi:putative spermidine/putrescine transport system substrate-binding protein
LSVASLGGGLQDAQQTTLFAPFSQQSGIHVQLDGWDGNLATLQKHAQTDSNDWDLVLMEEAPLRVACREGLFLSKPLTANPAETAPDSSGRDCGVGTWRMNLVLAWDKNRVDMTPSWADFWDVARRPGKRGLRRTPRGTLEIALMADGVAPEDVYRTLATPEGVDRAFRKLDQLKPYTVWWSTPAEAVQIIESGAVLMTSAPDGEIATANQTGHRNFGTQWAQSLGVAVSWAEPRATTPERRALTQRLLGFLVDPARQAAFLAAYPAVPATQANNAAPSQNAAAAPGGHAADDHRRATLMIDDGFWADHLVSLRRRFDSWTDGK